jgi:hypothetical protein
MSTVANDKIQTFLGASLLLAAPVLAQPCGNPWTLHTGPGPSARSRHATSYDSGRGKVVLFGGNFTRETWEWTAAGPGGGGSWLMRANSGPPPFHDAGLAYDSVRQRTVLYGGTQTWEWDGTVWAQIQTPSSPPVMSYVLMAYDTSRQRIVLVSTVGQIGTTYEYDGVTWVATATTTPVVVASHEFSMAYDAARSTMVMSGLVYNPGAFGRSTWERQTSGWTLNNIDILPGQTSGLAMTYDPGRSRVVYVDGRAYSMKSALWSYEAAQSTWHVYATDGPPLLLHRRPVFDHAGNQLLLFGGQDPSTGTVSDQTWLCRNDSRAGPVLTNVGIRQLRLSLGGMPGTLAVAAAGKATYQWRLNQIEISDGTTFQGSATPTLTINPEDYAATGDYDCLVTDSCGTSTRPFTFVGIGCYADCTGTSALSAEDFICFLTAFNHGCVNPNNCYPNCDGSDVQPILTANDFVCYLRAYIRGCN